jgi:hypothetical protein
MVQPLPFNMNIYRPTFAAVQGKVNLKIYELCLLFISEFISKQDSSKVEGNKEKF